MRELTHEELGMVSGGRRDEIVIHAPRRRPRSNAGFSPFNIGVFSPARSPFYLIAPEPITDEDLEISRAQNSAEDSGKDEIVVEAPNKNANSDDGFYVAEDGSVWKSQQDFQRHYLKMNTCGMPVLARVMELR